MLPTVGKICPSLLSVKTMAKWQWQPWRHTNAQVTARFVTAPGGLFFTSHRGGCYISRGTTSDRRKISVAMFHECWSLCMLFYVRHCILSHCDVSPKPMGNAPRQFTKNATQVSAISLCIEYNKTHDPPRSARRLAAKATGRKALFST